MTTTGGRLRKIGSAPTANARRDKMDDLFPDFELIARRLKVAAIVAGILALAIWIVLSVQGK